MDWKSNMDIITNSIEVNLGRATYSFWTNLIGRKKVCQMWHKAN